MTHYLLLAFGTVVVLLPGRLVARALGQRSTSATLAWALAAQFATWAVVLTVHGTIALQLWLLLAVGVVALLAGARRRVRIVFHLAHSLVLLGGIVLGALMWHVAGAVVGDGLFHLARVRKLVDLPHLHLRSLDELAKGGLHPGYAFPLWHGFLADVAKISGLDPSIVVQHEASLLVPVACLVAWEAGVAVFDSIGAGLAVLAATLGLFCFAAGHGGAWALLALPATAARQLLVPAGIALFFRFVASGRAADLAAVTAIFGALALVHPTYAIFALVPLGAYAVVRLVEWRFSIAALAAAVVPVGGAVLWLKPIVDETLSHNPSAAARANSVLHQYAGQLTVSSLHSYHLAPEMFGRTGAVAVAALALVPLGGFAARRRWGAFALGGSLAVLLLMLVSPLFVHFGDLVSLSQARRAAGFAPLPFAFAGGMALLARSIFVTPLALAAGVAMQIAWPGDFGYQLHAGGPAAVTWWALYGGAAALVAGLAFTRAQRWERPWRGAVAAALFVVPVAVHGFRTWTPLYPTDTKALSPTLVQELKRVPAGSVIIADPETSYHLMALAPVYVVASEVTHVAATRANNPRERAREVAAWLAHRAPGVPRRYGATWAVRRGRLYPLRK